MSTPTAVPRSPQWRGRRGGRCGRVNTRWKVGAAAVAAAVVIGYLSGGIIAVASGDENDGIDPPVATKYGEPMAAYTTLGNGKTAGNWRADTAPEDRPDYVPTRLEDGRRGYLKRSDIDDGFLMPEYPAGQFVDVSQAAEESARRRQDVMVQPDAKGEVWAPVYGEDGETPIGRQLMNP